jgi:hypothetical protein
MIMEQGGVSLLSMTASDAQDPQTLRMVAGAIANLCGNGKSNAFINNIDICTDLENYYFLFC